MENIGTYEDFIGSYSGIVSTEFCLNVIKAFDYYHDKDSVFCEDNQFEESMAGRFNWSIDLSHMDSFMKGDSSGDLNEVLQKCLQEYVHIFGHMKKLPLYSTFQKVQKTPAGGGYHIWHDELNGSNYAIKNRVLVWMLYLNDDFEGGETEFLYYKKRVQPEKGKLLIWPAGMTHAHRGGLVLEGMKYVITGWFHSGDIY